MKLSAVLQGLGLLASSGTSAFQPVSTAHRSFSTAVHSTPAARAAAYDTNVINIDERAERDLWTFDEWATNCGVQRCDGFQLTSDDGEDYYVVTTQDLPAGSPVLYVPSEMVLSSNRASEEFDKRLQIGEQQLEEGSSGNQVPLFRLVVKLLSEYEKGDQSPWYPWLNSLPRRFNNGASMTKTCFECLPPYAGWLAMKERANFVNIQKALQFSPLREQTVKDTNLCKWAYNVAATRSIQLSLSCRRIAPMVDFFNHNAEPNLDIQFDDDMSCTVYTTMDVPAGYPLTVSLGDPTNPSPLFATYGFLDESAPGTFCKLLDLQDEMKDLQLGFSDLLFYKNGEISPEVYDTILYSILKTDPSVQAPFYEACMNGDIDTKTAYHQQYFSYTLEVLKAHVEDMLRELDTLSAKAQSKDPATHPRVPVILKHNRFVKETFLNVKANLDQMG